MAVHPETQSAIAVIRQPALLRLSLLPTLPENILVTALGLCLFVFGVVGRENRNFPNQHLRVSYTNFPKNRTMARRIRFALILVFRSYENGLNQT